jgi:hypothetical protein
MLTSFRNINVPIAKCSKCADYILARREANLKARESLGSEIKKVHEELVLETRQKCSIVMQEICKTGYYNNGKAQKLDMLLMSVPAELKSRIRDTQKRHEKLMAQMQTNTRKIDRETEMLAGLRKAEIQ